MKLDTYYNQSHGWILRATAAEATPDLYDQLAAIAASSPLWPRSIQINELPPGRIDTRLLELLKEGG